MGLLGSLNRRERRGNALGYHQQVTNTGDLNSIIEDFDCHSDDCHVMHSAMGGMVVPPVSCSFSKVSGYEQILAVADEDGSVRILDTNESGSNCCKNHWVAHGNAIFDVAWLASEPKLLTASGDQSAVLWDLNPVVKLATFGGHSCSLKAVCSQNDNKFVFATCGRDGNIMIWDTRCNKRGDHYTPVDTIHSAHINPSVVTPKQRKKVRLSNTRPANDSQHSVTTVVFQDSNTLISAGAMDGAIKMWDLRKNYNRAKEPTPKHVFPYAGCSTRKRGFSSLFLDSTSSRLFASCTDDIIYQYDCVGISTTPVAKYTGHLNNSSFYVKASVSPDDQYLLSGSSDDNAYIWKVGQSQKPLFQLKGHDSEVTSVAWNHRDFTKIATCSDDNTVKVWRLNRRDSPLYNAEKSGWCEKINTSMPSVADNGAVSNNPMSPCVGVSVMVNSSMSSQPVGNMPSSPIHGAIVLSSQVSSVPKKTATLPITPPQNDSNKKYASPKLKNSSIKKWICRKTPTRQSPRKSPRKSPVKEKENLCKEGVSSRGVKRKIENDERFSKESKRKVSCDDEFVNDLKPLESIEDTNTLLTNEEPKITAIKQKPSTNEECNLTCRSPTVNLPNLITDLPKRDVGLSKNTGTKKVVKPKVNWLTQIVRQKRQQNGDDNDVKKPTTLHIDSIAKCTSPKLLKVCKNRPSSPLGKLHKDCSFTKNQPLSSPGGKVPKNSSFTKIQTSSPVRKAQKDSCKKRPISPVGRSRPMSPRIQEAPTSPKSPKSPNIRHYFQPLLPATVAK